MPWYEYACNDCGRELEVEQRISDDPLQTCPTCGSEGLERLVSRTSFSLKGSGWYADGYAGDRPAASPAAAKEESSPTEASSSDSSKDTSAPSSSPSADAKPADKPEAPAKTD